MRVREKPQKTNAESQYRQQKPANKSETEDQKLAAVKRNGWLIDYIDNPSLEVQLAAVQKSPRSIKYIKNPNESVQFVAVCTSASAIMEIENPTQQVCYIAGLKGYYR